MDRKTKKSIVTKNLENWYVIDSILFNDYARNVIQEGSVFKEYCALKASLLSNLFEYWNRTKYVPVNPEIPGKIKSLQEGAVDIAKKGKVLASDLMRKESVKKSLKKRIVTEAKAKAIKDVGVFMKKIVHEKFLQISIDNCLIGLPLLESRNVDPTCDFNCQILEHAHKMMRDSLVRLSLVCEKTEKKAPAKTE